MKKIILVLIIVLIITIPVNAFGIEKIDTDVTPYYETTKQIITGFHIDESGIANVRINLVSYLFSQITDVKADVSIINARNNIVVKSWSNKLLSEIDKGDFLFSEKYHLITKGQYYVSYSLKSYSEKTLKETIVDKTELKTYY